MECVVELHIIYCQPLDRLVLIVELPYTPESDAESVEEL